MNKHIELVKKWLADPQSVSLEELEENASSLSFAAAKANAAYNAAYNAADAAYNAAKANAAYAAKANAAYAEAVKQYEELKKEPDA